jgi:dolichol-phosphate mannosyltransferase
MPTLSILIPAYNEGRTIHHILNKVKAVELIGGYTKEVIIVNDCSTISRVEQSFQHHNLHIVNLTNNIGHQRSIACGLCYIKDNFKCDKIIVMDGDLQHDPKYLPFMINLFFSKKNDFLIATRNFSKEIMGEPRFILSFILVKIINVLLGYRTADPMSGFFIFKKSIYLRNKSRLYGLGFKILFDLLYAEIDFLLIKEFPFKFNNRKYHKSKMNFKILYILVKMIMFYFKKKFFRL